VSIHQLGERVPVIDLTAFVYDTATLIGLVILRARVNVWPYATIRGIA
jgi:carbonic anhydrase/acetyltransferase-like protein (isoleucine patch superfamily)